MERDNLNIREVELFKALNCWAEKECERQKLKADGPGKRAILGEQIVKKLRFPVMKQSDFMDVVLETNILTQDEANNITKLFQSIEAPPDGFIHTEIHVPLFGCCRYKNHFRIVSCRNNPGTYHPVRMTVDKDIFLHGVSFWAEESELYAKVSVTVKVYLGNYLGNKDSLLLSHTVKDEVEYHENAFCSYHIGFDVIFDKAVALKKNVPYCIAISTEWPDVSFYYGYGDVFDSIQYGGVTFYFVHEETLLAEFLFTIPD